MKTSLSDLDLFLRNVSTSGYSPLVFESLQAPITATGAQTLDGVTGALDPSLPMTISIADKNNNRIQFDLLINPTTLNHGKTVTVNSAYTRKGFVTQLWGPNQDTLSATGTTAAFMVPGTGLTAVDRRSSMGLHNFSALLFSYRNNGYELLDPSTLKDMTRVINVVRGVEITYDNQFYMGHFNTFTIDENAEKPFLFDYNFEFVVSSLSDNYNEVRGHFTPIGVNLPTTGLLKNLRRRGNTVLKSTLVPATGLNSSGDPSPTDETLDNSDSWSRAISFVLKAEGGYSNNKDDKGGETNFGISKNAHPNVDVKNLTLDQAKEIYYNDYWKLTGCDKLDKNTALVVMDSAVNFGPNAASSFLSGGNGDVGSIIDQRDAAYKRIVAKDPTQQQFLAGWLARDNALRAEVGIPKK